MMWLQTPEIANWRALFCQTAFSKKDALSHLTWQTEHWDIEAELKYKNKMLDPTVYIDQIKFSLQLLLLE